MPGAVAAGRTRRARLVGLLWLTHPFPTLLNGIVTGALALMAGGPPATAARLAVAMVALQASIGSLNDRVDAPRDEGHKLRKPIPAGHVTRAEAGAVALAGLVVGLLLAAPSGLPTLLVALAGVGTGYAYDLWLKGTAASWLPFAIGIPLLPVFAWVGATGSVPASFALLIPLAAASGSALAIANALADVERDEGAGARSIVTRLGKRPAWRLHAVLHALVVATALASLLLADRSHWPAAAASLSILAGVVIAGGGSARRRQLGWEIEAAGTGLLAVLWLAGLGTGGLNPA